MNRFAVLLLIASIAVANACCEKECSGIDNVCPGSTCLGISSCMCSGSCTGNLLTSCTAKACGGSLSGFCLGGATCNCIGGKVGDICLLTFIGILIFVGIVASIVGCCFCARAGSSGGAVIIREVASPIVTVPMHTKVADAESIP